MAKVVFKSTKNKKFNHKHRIPNRIKEVYLFCKGAERLALMTTSFSGGKFYVVFEVYVQNDDLRFQEFTISSGKHDYQEYAEREAILGAGFDFGREDGPSSAWEMLNEIKQFLGCDFFHITC